FIDNNVFACEGQSLDYSINATDVDEDSLEFNIEPSNVIFSVARPYSSQTISPYLTISKSEIFSGLLGKNEIGSYLRNISVKDNLYIDRKNVNLTVIEINNNPSFNANIGVQTIWGSGENRTFYKFINATDSVYELANYGNLSYNLSFLSGNQLFNVNSSTGEINFTANSSNIGVYLINTCAIDKGLPQNRIHSNISFCDSGLGNNKSVCETFQLTITNQNRQPRIVSYYPINLTFTASGTDNIFFNVSEYDPDGTIPDTYWYVDDSFKEYDNLSLYDTFVYSFGCGVSGVHRVKVVTTDGVLNDSLQWNVSVQDVLCPSEPTSGGGGGGGGGKPLCLVKWACNDWFQCQSAVTGLSSGFLIGDIYRQVQSNCTLNSWNESVCGYQERFCNDVGNCNKTIGKPFGVQSCYFTENPSCEDNIKNCHDNSCEF
ncbi:MAG: hypothetical protein AABY10_05235, partial [Nanoarchaeota archaeon]